MFDLTKFAIDCRETSRVFSVGVKITDFRWPGALYCITRIALHASFMEPVVQFEFEW